jgi:hypothetical protein
MQHYMTNDSPGNKHLMMPTVWKTYLRALLSATLLFVFSTSAFSYPTYEDCKACHGDFNGDDYVSNKDGSVWGMNLMEGHGTFVPECFACHKSGSRGEVFLNLSNDSNLSMGCVGCHGRVEDINNNCSPVSGGAEVHCGSGAGLREHHETEVGSGTCSSCHESDPTPVGEDIAPFNYGEAGVSITNSCDADGTESRFGPTGLDNDGDGQTDSADTDCQSNNTPPTQPGGLSASAITPNSATVSWGASTDDDGDTITYQVDYRRNGDVSWTSGGSTTVTSLPLSGLDASQSYDVQVIPNDGTEDGPERTAVNLFQTEVNNEVIFRDSFETTP